LLVRLWRFTCAVLYTCNGEGVLPWFWNVIWLYVTYYGSPRALVLHRATRGISVAGFLVRHCAWRGRFIFFSLLALLVLRFHMWFHGSSACSLLQLVLLATPHLQLWLVLPAYIPACSHSSPLTVHCWLRCAFSVLLPTGLPLACSFVGRVLEHISAQHFAAPACGSSAVLAAELSAVPGSGASSGGAASRYLLVPRGTSFFYSRRAAVGSAGSAADRPPAASPAPRVSPLRACCGDAARQEVRGCAIPLLLDLAGKLGTTMVYA